MKYLLCLLLNILLLNTIFCFNAYAKKNKEFGAKSAVLVVNSKTGKIIYQQNAGKYRYPASLTKMMTLYILFDHLKKKNILIDQYFKVSHHASKQPRMNISLAAGESISVRNLILSIIIRSANDSAVVVAESLLGSEKKFAKYMTKIARENLGMKNTTFKNASGLHNKNQKTTAYDIARLAIAIERDFPEYYHFFKKNKFIYKGKVYKSHNRVVANYQGADGLKTGYVRASGFNIVVSANKHHNKLIGIVMGEPTHKKRDQYVIKLLDSAFYNLLGGGKHNYHIPVKKPRFSMNIYSLLSKKILQVEDYYTCGIGAPLPKLKVAYYNSKKQESLEKLSYIFSYVTPSIPKLKSSLFYNKVKIFPKLKAINIGLEKEKQLSTIYTLSKK